MTLRAAVTDFTFPTFGPYTDVLDRAGVELVVPTEPTLEGFLAIADTADAVLHEHLDLTSTVIARMGRCRVIAHHGKGVDNIDLAAATRQGIVVANVLDASLYEMAEHVFTLALAVARRLRNYSTAVRNGTWHVRSGEPVYRLHGKTLGLIGFGRIAQQVALTGAALGMQVVAYARAPQPLLASHLGVRYVTMDEAIQSADVLSLHLPLTAATHGILNAERIGRMKPTAILINVSRGALVDECALLQALTTGRLFGAGLDVLKHEPAAVDHPLLQLEQVVVTPHCAWYSEEGRADVERRTASAALAVLHQREPESWVNPESRGTFASRWGPLYPFI